MERDGQSLQQMVDWLAAAPRNLKVSRPTVCRLMAKIRDVAPILPVTLDPANEDDDLKIIRSQARREMNLGAEWRQRHSAMAILMRAAELLRKNPTLPAPAARAGQTAAPAPMTPDQEAAAVRAQLGKMN